MRKPFFKKTHQSWYVQIDGRQVRLGPDRDEAFKEYHRLMAGELPATSRTTAAQLIGQFLDWTKANRAEQTYDWYAFHCNSFVKYIGQRLRVTDIRAYHVTRWLEKCYGHTGDNHKNGACRSIARALNWARKQGLISLNPIAGMERPAATSRDVYLTLEQWAAFIALVKESDPLYDFLVFLWETGARPHEARIADAKDFDRVNRRIILDRKDSKGKKHRRVIRLNEKAFAIVDRLAKEGPIFRNRVGRGWAKESIVCRFAKLSKKVGFRVHGYVLRHSFVTHALLRGVDPLTVGILAGHKDATMVMRVYSHLAQNDEFLAAKLKQATGEDAA
jgi:integrase